MSCILFYVAGSTGAERVKMTTALTHLHETHATVTYNFGHGFEDNYFDGWVWLDARNPGVVCARKFGGRRNFQLCKIDDVISVQVAS